MQTEVRPVGHHKVRLIAAMVVVVSAGACLAQVQGRSGADWPHWRGPDRTGITTESSGWDEGAWPPPVMWTRQVGAGATSPIVADGLVYVMGWADDTDTVYCIDPASGQDVWTRSYGCPRYGRYHQGDEGHYFGPSATPEYDAETGYLYTLSLDGDLNCWNARGGGSHVWGVNLYNAYGVQQRPEIAGVVRDYGYTCSPLVHGEWVIAEVGSPEGTLMAFDKRSGVAAWASECTFAAGHTSGLVPMTVQGVPCAAVLTARGLLVARLDPGHEGETAATYDWQTQGATNIPTPAVLDDCIVLSTGYNVHKTARLRATLEGASPLWESRHFTRVASPVIHEGRVYLASQKLRCLNYETGALIWEGGSVGDDASCVVTGDGRLVVFAGRKLRLCEGAERSPGAYRELATVNGPDGGASWPHVVLAGGRVLAKDLVGNLWCLDLTGERPPLSIFSFSAADATPDWGGTSGLWPQVEGCGGEATWVAEDAEGGAGGSMRIVYDIGAEPRSFSMWFAPGRNVDLSAYDRLVIYARGDVPSFTLVVKDSSADPEGATDAGIADASVTGVTDRWQRFEIPFTQFVPRVAGAPINWSEINHAAVALIGGRDATSGTLQVDNLGALSAE